MRDKTQVASLNTGCRAVFYCIRSVRDAEHFS